MNQTKLKDPMFVIMLADLIRLRDSFSDVELILSDLRCEATYEANKYLAVLLQEREEELFDLATHLIEGDIKITKITDTGEVWWYKPHTMSAEEEKREEKLFAEMHMELESHEPDYMEGW